MSKHCSIKICPLVVNNFVVEWVSLSSWWVISMSSLLLKSFLSDLNDSSKAKTSCLISFVWYKWCNINVMQLQELEVRSNSRTKGPKHFQNFGKLSGKFFEEPSEIVTKSSINCSKPNISIFSVMYESIDHLSQPTTYQRWGLRLHFSMINCTKGSSWFELQIFGYSWCSFGLYESSIPYEKYDRDCGICFPVAPHFYAPYMLLRVLTQGGRQLCLLWSHSK